jgi:hypothetical protein
MNWTVIKLKAEAKRKSIKGYSTMNKATLLQKLNIKIEKKIKRSDKKSSNTKSQTMEFVEAKTVPLRSVDLERVILFFIPGTVKQPFSTRADINKLVKDYRMKIEDGSLKAISQKAVSDILRSLIDQALIKSNSSHIALDTTQFTPTQAGSIFITDELRELSKTMTRFTNYFI